MEFMGSGSALRGRATVCIVEVLDYLRLVGDWSVSRDWGSFAGDKGNFIDGVIKEVV